jgi:hypothetical protein
VDDGELEITWEEAIVTEFKALFFAGIGEVGNPQK